MIRLFCALVLLFTAAATVAAEVPNLYQALAPVKDQSQQQREAMAEDLLQQVIVKVVGDRQVVKSADLTEILADSERYISQYAYQQINDNSDMTTPEQLALILSFDEQNLNKALNRIGLPLWGRHRPEILFWLASDFKGGKQLIGEDDVAGLTQPLQYHAKRRGLPVLLPVMDLEDQMQISFDDIWTGNDHAIRAASERYDTPVIVASRMQGNAEKAKVSWQMYLNGQSERWHNEGNLEAAIQNGIDELADRLGRKFNFTMQGAQQFSMQISEVNSYTDYTRLLEYLNGLQGVSGINVLNLSEQRLDLILTFNGAKDKFSQLLQFGKILQATTQSSEETVQQYRLLP